MESFVLLALGMVVGLLVCKLIRDCLWVLAFAVCLSASAQTYDSSHGYCHYSLTGSGYLLLKWGGAAYSVPDFWDGDSWENVGGSYGHYVNMSGYGGSGTLRTSSSGTNTFYVLVKHSTSTGTEKTLTSQAPGAHGTLSGSITWGSGSSTTWAAGWAGETNYWESVMWRTNSLPIKVAYDLWLTGTNGAAEWQQEVTLGRGDWWGYTNTMTQAHTLNLYDKEGNLVQSSTAVDKGTSGAVGEGGVGPGVASYDVRIINIVRQVTASVSTNEVQALDRLRGESLTMNEALLASVEENRIAVTGQLERAASGIEGARAYYTNLMGGQPWTNSASWQSNGVLAGTNAVGSVWSLTNVYAVGIGTGSMGDMLVNIGHGYGVDLDPLTAVADLESWRTWVRVAIGWLAAWIGLQWLWGQGKKALESLSQAQQASAASSIPGISSGSALGMAGSIVAIFGGGVAAMVAIVATYSANWVGEAPPWEGAPAFITGAIAYLDKWVPVQWLFSLGFAIAFYELAIWVTCWSLKMAIRFLVGCFCVIVCGVPCWAGHVTIQNGTTGAVEVVDMGTNSIPPGSWAWWLEGSSVRVVGVDVSSVEEGGIIRVDCGGGVVVVNTTWASDFWKGVVLACGLGIALLVVCGVRHGFKEACE